MYCCVCFLEAEEFFSLGSAVPSCHHNIIIGVLVTVLWLMSGINTQISQWVEARTARHYSVLTQLVKIQKDDNGQTGEMMGVDWFFTAAKRNMRADNGTALRGIKLFLVRVILLPSL